MTLDNTDTSESVRQKGNELYKAAKFADAIALYQEAARLAPTQAAPRSNLSAAYFESGRYKDCDEASNLALKLLGDIAPDAPAKQKLILRQAKARLCMLRLDEAQTAVDQLVDGEDKKSPATCLASHRSNRLEPKDLQHPHTRLILEVPRYKPMIQSIPEYFTIGHDMPEPLFSKDLLETGRKKISLLFGGIGDARHLLMSMFSIAGEKSAMESDKLFHFTIVDIKPAVIARDLLLFLMLWQPAETKGDTNAMARTRLLPCLYYTYLAPHHAPQHVRCAAESNQQSH
jgi:tetratricopeptide (TPR) repeat protein